MAAGWREEVDQREGREGVGGPKPTAVRESGSSNGQWATVSGLVSGQQ